MKEKKMKLHNLTLACLIFVSLLFFSGCYTQLARRPYSKRIVQTTYYDSYVPYNVSIYVGQHYHYHYHSRYYDPFYDMFFYGYYGSRYYYFDYTIGFYFSRGHLRHGSHGYYPKTTVVHSVPKKQRKFTRRSHRGSDFGYERPKEDSETSSLTKARSDEKTKTVKRQKRRTKHNKKSPNKSVKKKENKSKDSKKQDEKRDEEKRKRRQKR